MLNRIQRIPRHVWIVIGLVLFVLSDVVDFLTSSTSIVLLLKTIGILLFLSQFFMGKYNKPEGKTKEVFGLFLVWSFFLILRGSLTGRFPLYVHSYMQVGIDVVVNRYSGMAYIMPLVALMTIRMDSFYYMKQISILLCCISLVMIFTHWQDVFSPDLQYGRTEIESETEAGQFLNIYDITDVCFIGTWLILLLSFSAQYFEKKILLIFYPFLLLAFGGSVVGGRRAASFYNGLFLLITFCMYYKYNISDVQVNNQIRRARLLFRRVFVIVLAGGLVYYIVQLAQTTTTFDFLSSRMFADNNSGQLSNTGREMLVADMVKDFNSHPLSWIFGRGVNGSYETSILSIGGRRQAMEWGFLCLILKGGIPYLIMYVYLLLHAFVMGIYHSKNLPSKGLAFICLLCVILLVDVYTPSYGLYYFMAWFSFGLLENEKFRQLDDVTIKNCFNIKGFGKMIKVN